jgi:hypothetical protein
MRKVLRETQLILNVAQNHAADFNMVAIKTAIASNIGHWDGGHLRTPMVTAPKDLILSIVALAAKTVGAINSDEANIDSAITFFIDGFSLLIANDKY